MIQDEVSTNIWVTPVCDGDIRLGKGGTQKFLAVDVRSTNLRNRSRATSRFPEN